MGDEWLEPISKPSKAQHDMKRYLFIRAQKLGDFSKYRRIVLVLTLFAHFFSNNVVAQQCSEISFEFTHFEPCKFRLTYQSSSECYTQIRLALSAGEFGTLNVNAGAGFTLEVISPSEVWINHQNGFLPLGFQGPLIFNLPPDLVANCSIAYINDCPPGIGCDIFPGPLLESCTIVPDACIVGTVYLECNNLPYSNQPGLGGFTVTLLSNTGIVLDSMVSDASGAYSFCDLLPGNYIVRTSGPGWTSSVPASGQYAVSLSQSETENRDFGLCPVCSCDDIFVGMQPVPGNSDTSCFTVSVLNTGAFCFTHVDVSLTTGQIVSASITEPGWSVETINASTVRLKPTGATIPEGSFAPLRLCATGSAVLNFVTEAHNHLTCTRGYAFPNPTLPVSPNCCPAGSTPGPELLVNGDFEAGYSNFTSGPGITAGCTCGAGTYCILHNFNDKCNQWPSLFDHTFGTVAGNYLVIDGSENNAATVWASTVAVETGKQYCFSFWAASIYPAGFSLGMMINGAMPAGSTQVISQPFTTWTFYSYIWTSNVTGTIPISLEQLTAGGKRDFGLDDISFLGCITPPCEASFTITQIDNCGHVQVVGTPTGLAPFSYQWCDANSAPSFETQLPCGETTFCVTITCADGSTSTASQTITITDNIPPVARCVPSFQAPLNGCIYPVSALAIDNGSTDNCFIKNITVDQTSLSGCGDNTVTLTVEDWCGNISTCTTGIQTIETVPPVITNCPQNQTVSTDPGVCYYTYNPVSLLSTDNCDLNPTITCTWEDPNGMIQTLSGPVQMPKGRSTIRCKAKDQCGNESLPCVYNILVEDQEKPVITCPQNVTVQGVLAPNGICVATVNNISPAATDNCPILNFTYSIFPSGVQGTVDASGNSFPQGVSTVTYGVTDCGNFTKTCSFTVTVNCPPPACDMACSTGSINISTGYQAGSVAGFIPGLVSQSWVLVSAPASSGLTGPLPFPGHMTTSTSWASNGNTWLSAYNFNDLTTLNGTPGNGAPFVYEREFCVCDDGNVVFNFDFLSDDCGKVELTGPSGFTTVLLVDNCNSGVNNSQIPTTVTNHTEFLQPGTYHIRVSHWNTTGAPMGVNLLGTVTGQYLVKDDCCTPQKGCFLIRKYDDRNYNTIYDWNTATWTSLIDNPLSGWYYTINGTTYGPTDVQGELLICNLPPGTYTVTENPQPGYVQCSGPPPSNINLSGVQILEFGNCQNIGCTCGSFSDLYARWAQGLQSQPVVCGAAPVMVGCPNPGFGYAFSGKFTCLGNCQSNPPLHWSVTGPSGTHSGNTAVVNDFFGFQLLPSYCAMPGLYTLTLTSSCDGVPCNSCVIQFQVVPCPDPCPCDLADFQADLSKGFASTLWASACRACFSPLALTDCDEVEWFINGISVGTALGNQSFCHNFPAPGIYNVMMAVTRRKTDGSICAFNTFSTHVTLTCTVIPHCTEAVFRNPTFSEGAVAGGLNSGGASTGWYGPCGDPTVVIGSVGSHDSATILLTGNLDSSDVLSQLEPVCLKKDSGVISLRFGIREQGIKSALNIQLYQGDVFEMNDCDGITCFDLARIDLSAFDTGWVDLQIPYDLRNWDAVETCDNGEGVLVRPAIFVTNAIGSEQGGVETRSSIEVDNVCLQGNCVVSFVNCPTDMTIVDCDNTGNELFTYPEIMTAQNGNCVGGTMVFSAGPTVGTIVPVGNYPVSYQLHGLDAQGNFINSAFCTFTVHVIADVTAPVLGACPPDFTIQALVNANGDCLAQVNWNPPTATDNCIDPGAFLQSNIHLGDHLTPGQHVVVYNAIDASSNVSTNTCSFTITVLPCVTGTTESDKPALTLRIQPNPNPGVFTVSFSEALSPGMGFQITGISGQVLQQQPVQAGSLKQTVQASDLPPGLYFLQLVSEGKMLAMEKFVKQ